MAKQEKFEDGYYPPTTKGAIEQFTSGQYVYPRWMQKQGPETKATDMKELQDKDVVEAEQDKSKTTQIVGHYPNNPKSKEDLDGHASVKSQRPISSSGKSFGDDIKSALEANKERLQDDINHIEKIDIAELTNSIGSLVARQVGTVVLWGIVPSYSDDGKFELIVHTGVQPGEIPTGDNPYAIMKFHLEPINSEERATGVGDKYSDYKKLMHRNYNLAYKVLLPHKDGSRGLITDSKKKS